MTARELWVRLTYPLRRQRIARELREELDLHVAGRGRARKDDPVAQHRIGPGYHCRVHGDRRRAGHSVRLSLAREWADDVLPIALGARPTQVIALVVRKTMRPVIIGALLGGGGAVGVSLLLRAMIAMPDAPDLTFGAGALNPMVFVGVVAALVLVVAAACYVPARRAAGLEPTVALRSD